MPLFRFAATLLPAVGAGLLLLGAAQGAHAQSTTGDKMARHITVSATGSVEASPDVARVQTGVVIEGDTAAQALAGNTAAMRKLMQAGP